MPRLLAAISPHGFGHAMQTCLVLNALRERLPELELVLHTLVPENFLRGRLRGPFSLVPRASDFGMLMRSAVDIDLQGSAARYAALHANWESAVEAEARRLADSAPDLILANVPYLALAGAKRAGIPAVALCSLNWAEIYRHYCAARPEAPRIHAQILSAYQSAEYFLQTTPAMPMPGLDNLRPIPPLAQSGHERRADILARLGLPPEKRLVLAGLGGFDLHVPLHAWPMDPELHWLVPAAWQARRPDCTAWEDLGLSFIDTLRSSDALLTKPGYGSFAEAACNGVPVIYVERGDWPETPALEAWLAAHGRAARISRAALDEGAFLPALKDLLRRPGPPPPRADGAAAAAELLRRFFP